MSIRILLTCSRSWREFPTVRSVLEQAHGQYPNAVLVHGDAKHGDRDAAGIWRSLGGEDKRWPADWVACALDCEPGHQILNWWGALICPTAGIRRNVAMVESAPDMCLAFLDPQSKTKGAYHCSRLAIDAGIRTVVYRQGEPGATVHNAIGEGE